MKPDVKSFIIDTELTAYDKVTDKYLPFQILSQRSRKWVTEKDLETKVCICAFDMLYLNGQSLLEKPLLERRQSLHESFTESQDFMFARFKDITADFDSLPSLLEESVKDNCEGLMLKSL